MKRRIEIDESREKIVVNISERRGSMILSLSTLLFVASFMSVDDRSQAVKPANMHDVSFCVSCVLEETRDCITFARELTLPPLINPPVTQTLCNSSFPLCASF